MENTRTSLLRRARQGEESAWRRVVELYQPLIRAWLLRQRLSPQEAEDLTQDILAVLVKELPRFEHGGRPGAFRAWLRTITVNRARAYWRAGSGRSGRAALQQVEELAAPDGALGRLWDEEHDAHVLRRLLALMEQEFEPATLQAFRRLTFDGLGAGGGGRAGHVPGGGLRRQVARLAALAPGGGGAGGLTGFFGSGSGRVAHFPCRAPPHAGGPMTPPTEPHPSADQLRSFSRGRLGPAEMAGVQAHLEGCPGCCSALEAPDDDPFIDLLRRAARPATPTPGGGAETVGLTPALAAAPGPAPTVPGHEILRELGRGGMGVVYKARHLRLNRLVALKVLLAGAHAGPEALVRFRAEAEAVARLRHPHIVQIYDIGEHEGLPWFALELCEGGSLAEQARGVPCPPRQAARLVEAVARGVAAHEQGIVHRDLKPANILLARKEEGQGRPTDEFEPRVADFGLAKWAEGGGGLTGTGAVVGTPGYMAPEQACGDNRSVGPAADVYALGAILYELLTGRPPFQAATALETLEQVVGSEAAPPRRLNPRVPADLETIALKALRKEPEKRYAGAAALAEDLRRFQAGEPIAARPAGALERGWRWAKRHPAVAALTAAVAGVLLAGVAGVTWQWREAVHQKELAQEQTGVAREQTKRTTIALKKAEAAEKQASDRAVAEARARAEAIKESRRAEVARYSSELELVRRDLLAGHYGDARARLDGCRWDLRGWEYDFMRGLLDRRLRILPGHTDHVVAVAFRPDGRLLASAAYDGTIRLWEPDTGLETRLLRTPAPVRGVAFSPDGRLLASAGLDGRLILWNARTGRPFRTLGGPPGRLSSVAFSPDGRMLAAGAADRTVKLWDVRTGRPVRGLGGHEDVVSAVAFTADGRLASSSIDGTARLWDVRTGKQVLALRHSAPVYGLAFRRDGLRLATASEEGARVWDVRTGKQVLSVGKAGSEAARAVAFSPDGKRLAVARSLWPTTIHDAETGKEEQLIRLIFPQQFVGAVFSPDGKRLACADFEGRTVCLIETGPLEEAQPVREVAGSWDPGLSSPDGRYLLRDRGGQLTVWDTRTGRQRSALAGAGRMAGFSPDGARVAGLGADVRLAVYEPSTGREVFALEGLSREVARVALSPNGARLAVVPADKSTVEVRNLAGKRAPLLLSRPGETVGRIAFSSDGERLAVVWASGRVLTVQDAADGRALTTLEGAFLPDEAPAFSADGRRLAAACRRPDAEQPRAAPGGLVVVWEIATGRKLLTLEGADGGPVFSPDSRWLVARGPRGTVKRWDAKTGAAGPDLRRTGGVRLSFSADGKRLVSPGSGEVWEAATGKVLPRLWEPSGSGHVVDASPGGRLQVGKGREVQVWDTSLRRRVFSREKGDGSIGEVALSGDGRRLAVVWNRVVVQVWDAATGKEGIRLPDQLRSPNPPVFSPDGKYLAVSTVPGAVRLYDAARGRLTRILRKEVPVGEIGVVSVGAPGGVTEIAFRPDGRYLAAATFDGALYVWEVATGRRVASRREDTRPIYHIAFSPDGRLLAAASGGGTMRLWDARTWAPVLSFNENTQSFPALGFSPDGRRLTTASRMQTVKVWDTATGQELLTLNRDYLGFMRGLGFAPGGRCLVGHGTVPGDWPLVQWQTPAVPPPRTLSGHAGGVNGLALGRDGRLFSASSDGSVKAWDLGTGLEVRTWADVGGPVGDVAVSPDGSRVACAWTENPPPSQTRSFWDLTGLHAWVGLDPLIGNPALRGLDGKPLRPLGGRVTVREAATGRRLLTLNEGQADVINNVCFSPDGRRLAGATSGGQVKVWDAGTGRLLRTLRGHTAAVRVAAFSADGRRLVTASADKTARLWDADTGKQVLAFRGHQAGVLCAAFGPGGRVVSSAADGAVRVWRAATGAELLALPARAGPVTVVAFSPDGSRLLTAGGMTLELWDAATGRALASLRRHTDTINWAAFLADGRQLASASDDRTIQVWDLSVLPPANPSSEARPAELSRRPFVLAKRHITRGVELAGRGRHPEARREYQRALDLLRKLLEANPEAPEYQSERARAHYNLGHAVAGLGKREQARTQFLRASELQRELLEDYPWTPGYQQHLARTHNNLGWLLNDLGRREQALGELRKARDLKRELVELHPDKPAYREDLIRSCVGCGAVRAQMDQLRTGLADLDEAVTQAEGLRGPGAPFLLACLPLRAELLARLGRHDRADADWDRAMKTAAPAQRGGLRLRRAAGRARAGDYRRAAGEADELARLDALPGAVLYELARIEAVSAAAAGRDAGRPLPERDKRRERYARAALALLRRAAAAGFFTPERIAGVDGDADLAALRGRRDYERFRARLSRPAATGQPGNDLQP
jgi:WD40 repeat protein/DNA-directed RNA polymerase specialized sigma24 family protein